MNPIPAVVRNVALLLAALAAPAGATFANPLLWADVPDTCLLRVGDTYYMSSTTMHLSPGLPVMMSRDLVNWRIASYAYDTLADNEALRLERGANAYGAGSWASSLRHHDGTFYVSTFSSTSGRTHIYSTKDPATGPWKETSFAPALHDHSLFFDDDGRTYMVLGAGRIRLVELAPGLTGLKPGGVDQVIIENASRVANERVGLPAEGSQLWKANGKYYLFNITWPPGDMRTALVHRADRITGPYEGRVVLRDRGIAQGGLIDTPDGRWFACMFQDHGAVGRIPFLMPVRWEDDWPVLGEDGKVPDTLDLPPSRGLGNLVASDEFDRRPGAPPLPPAWQWNHNPDHRHWSLTARRGALRLTTGRVDAALPEARNTLTQRTFGPACAGHTAVDTSGMRDGDCAGLAAFQKHYGFIGVKREGDARSIVMVAAPDGAPRVVASAPLAGPVVHLKVSCDFRDRADRATFHYSLDGKAWTALGEPLPMRYTLPHFMGYRFALFNFATKAPGGHADFDFFRVGADAPPPAPAAAPPAAPPPARGPARGPARPGRGFDRPIVLGPDDKPACADPPAGFAARRDGIPRGRLEMVEYDSKTVGTRRRMHVYTPPGYAAENRLPVLYLLHGIGGDETEWQRLATPDVILDNLLADGKAVPMIVVMPNGRARKNDRAEGNVFESAPAFATFERDLLDDVIPAVDARYATRADREHRALAGLSMGGGQALNFGLAHLDTFAWVGGFSAAPNTKPPAELLPDPAAAKRQLKLLWLSCGNRDGLINISQGVHGYLKDHDVPHVWHVDGNGHDATHWRNGLHFFAQRIFR